MQINQPVRRFFARKILENTRKNNEHTRKYKEHTAISYSLFHLVPGPGRVKIDPATCKFYPVARRPMLVKPMFLVFIYKSRTFFSGKTHCFFSRFFNFSLHFPFGSLLVWFYSKTNGFFGFKASLLVKPMVFQHF